jgi:predicted nucleotidyltransferase
MIDNIEKIKKVLARKADIEFAYLFGSKAKGIKDKRSDWDIAIYFKKDSWKLSKWAAFYLEAEITREISEDVQVIILNDLDSPVFLFQIIKDGLLLVDNNTSKRILYEAKVLKKYHDWHYFLRRHMAYK